MADVIIIGAGHNGLVTACYLAKKGHDVTVFEKRPIIGGCCATDESIFPGFKVSSAAYVNSLFLPQIVDDLGLKNLGYEVLPRVPSSFTPLPNGGYLILGRGATTDAKEISKFSKSDAENYPKYEAMLDKVAKFMADALTITPPNLPPLKLSDWKNLLRLGASFFRLGPVGGWNLCGLMANDAVSLLNNWFENDALKATLLLDSTIGALDFRGYLLLHHVMGEAGGKRGIWGYQRGGMGGIAKALEKFAHHHGVNIYTDTAVTDILIENNKAVGVELDNGEQRYADIIVSNADPKTTFLKLMPLDNPLPDTFTRRTKSLDFSSAVMKVNLALSGLPRFYCWPTDKLGPQHKGTIHLAPSVNYILQAAEEARNGLPSTSPVLEITIPSAVDETLAPTGRHLMNIFVQYTPYRIKNTSWHNEKEEYFKSNVLGVMREYISNIDDIIEGVHILSPLDLEREFSLAGGNIFHGAMTLDQMFSFRPVRGYADYQTPVKNLYLCGAGTHPGGGVSGANGYNAAREILKKIPR